MRYLSICSGIEAATQAWHPLGWEAVAYSEIEEFPSKVLAHHYPDVPNLGDMTKLIENEYVDKQHIDLIVGGTPCQSFSVAGLRNGLADERGNLSLEFIRLLMHKRPKWFLWENVPGVLSSNGGADFASILSGWTGRDIAPQSFGISGIIQGDFYSIAWRVLDSRYFGVPQRRRRVFVVGHIGGDWRPPVAVLFERQSLSRDFTPSGSKKKRTPKGTEGSAGVGSKQWPEGFRMTAFGEYADDNTASTLKKRDYKDATDLVVMSSFGISANIVDRTEKSGCQGLGVIENESYTLTKSDRHCVMQPANSYKNVIYSATVGCLQARDYKGVGSQYVDESKLVIAQPIVLDDQGGSVMSVYENGQTGTLQAQTHGHEPIVCIPLNTMTIQGRPSDNGRMGLGVGEDGEPQNTLTKAHSHAVFVSAPKSQPAMVRRLTPLECERLQGFPDGYTNIPGATDAKRYAAIGNSMTVQVMAWIGKRIDIVNTLTELL